jgi:hypothetical protein
MRPLAEDLGIAGILFAICVFLVRYLEHRFKKKSHKDALKESTEFFRDNVRTPFLAYLGLFVVLGFASGPYKLYRQDEQRLVDYGALKTQVADLQQKNIVLNNQVQKLTPKTEASNSLRRRTDQLANELQKYLNTRYQEHPPRIYPDSSIPNPDEDRKKAIKKAQDYDQETQNYFLAHFQERMVGILKEYDAKGVRTGYLIPSAGRGSLNISPVGFPYADDCSDDLVRFRELAYHVDAQDNLIVVTP